MGASQTKSTTNIKELNETNLSMTQETFKKIDNPETELRCFYERNGIEFKKWNFL